MTLLRAYLELNHIRPLCDDNAGSVVQGLFTFLRANKALKSLAVHMQDTKNACAVASES
jgi:hypothetical protein